MRIWFVVFCCFFCSLLQADFSRFDRLMESAVEEKAFPGGVLLIAKGERTLYARAFGTMTYTDSTPVTLETIFDLASLTKVIATAPAILKLCEEGRINLEDRLTWYFPEFEKQDYGKITLRQMLQHISGLAADIPPWFKERDFLALRREAQEEKIWDYIFHDSLLYPPNTTIQYSDLGFMLLGKIVEKVSGRSLEEYVQEKFFIPLHMIRTAFLPLEKGFSLEEIAPTEVDVSFRKRLVHGTVHDEKADAVGGIAGHAGLFSTAGDLLTFMQMLLNDGAKEGLTFFSPKTVHALISFPRRDSTYALGFERMPLFAEEGFGHFGFTGTSIWVDPKTGLIMILLTNRVHPSRDNIKIREVRRRLIEAISFIR